jgi:hypothetical protein
MVEAIPIFDLVYDTCITCKQPQIENRIFSLYKLKYDR